jgi:hypothetical protein
MPESSSPPFLCTIHILAFAPSVYLIVQEGIERSTTFIRDFPDSWEVGFDHWQLEVGVFLPPRAHSVVIDAHSGRQVLA